MGITSQPKRQQPLPLLAPMLAVTAPELPADQDQWSFEPKFDGFRAQLLLDGGQVRLRSRTGKPMNWLPELAILGQALPTGRLILDGELVALVNGRPSIAALQQRMRTRHPTATGAPVLLAVFDLLFLDKELLIGRPYRQRRAMLEDLELPDGAFQVVPAVAGAGQAMLAAVRQQDLEGVLAKRLDSSYRPGVRSRDWRKILAKRRLRVLVGGFVPAAAGVGGLLVGEPDPAADQRLRFLGRVDHGFTPRTRRALAEVLTPLVTDRSPFSGPVGWGAGWGRPAGPPPRWVHPVVEVAVEHIGRDPTTGQLRHPTLAGTPSQP